ncbi:MULTISPECIES: MBL fold metallo-hydrolase [Pasteurellaceae]|uniref:MBL fold metallo-hydrolase n=1 Tax=Pasteurella atlantica TaxID=2827233 RepID=A0AAW8CK86_9PAST|nr:MBL fold metallo-hydrolase [Pasteurella atlantica]MBR0572649.1 MBL fold metallo-hydrolase [Pasteurella atlantica]MDP8038595.1 MBL fold metallo-hydrolase [Pasteurella atlantica]MDP8040687.1 MBL fold metallo-hydrolase [Pasteurella atlantica]MDP8042822.1 MBL fold metallo-hydrolase [Pasteurella atlantica]MDP8044909.1 MBL fold metallo-hydrolase [Pasteurella atlantica]
MLKKLLLLIVSLVVIVVLYVNLHPTFGDSPNTESMVKIQQSTHFDGEHFQNLVPTNATSIGKAQSERKIDRVALIMNFIFPPKGKNPEQPLITQKLNLNSLKNGEFVWLGHSSVLFKTNNTTIMTDPVFHNAAPIPFVVEPFKMTNKPTINDLPFIDIVLISHDHYDHLDYQAIKQMKAKVGHFYVPLGVKAHLLRWGIKNEKVTEYDWYEGINFNHIQFVFAPSRHFSGRGIFNHRQTLWGSWAVIAPEIKVYFSGDGGYSPEFTKIGQRFGGFDIAFMEDGAYNESWKDIHMLPEQTAQASIDIQTKVVLPIHWGKFDLATHQWNEPVQRIAKALQKYNNQVLEQDKIKLVTPRIGEVFDLNKLPKLEWWEE